MRIRQLDPKLRRPLALANISLVIGLLLWLFVHPTAEIEKNILHAASGFLLGLSITINLAAFRFARRCRESQS